MEFRRSQLHGRARDHGGKVSEVYSVNIISLNVLDQQGQTFTCELEIEAELSLDIDVEIESHYGYGPDDYEPEYRQSISQTQIDYLLPRSRRPVRSQDRSLGIRVDICLGRFVSMILTLTDARTGKAGAGLQKITLAEYSSRPYGQSAVRST